MGGGTARGVAADQLVNACLVDSSVVIDWLRGHESVVAWLTDMVAGGARLSVTPITRAEVLARVSPARRDQLASLLTEFGWQELARDVRMQAAVLYGQRQRSGSSLPLPDLLQAAAALEGQSIMATSNIRHFPDVAAVDPANMCAQRDRPANAPRRRRKYRRYPTLATHAKKSIISM